MVRSVLYLAFAMLASSAIAGAMVRANVPVSCTGPNAGAHANEALRRVLAHETCVAAETRP
jgi:hypothetical protein